MWRQHDRQPIRIYGKILNLACGAGCSWFFLPAAHEFLPVVRRFFCLVEFMPINSPFGTSQKASWRNWFDSNCNCSKQELLSWASLRFAAARVTDLLEPQHWCTEWVEGTQHVQKEKMNTLEPQHWCTEWVEGTQHVQKEKMNTPQNHPVKVPNSLPLVPVIVDLTLVISHSFASLEAHWIDNLLSEQQHCRQNLKHSRPWMNTWLNIFKR